MTEPVFTISSFHETGGDGSKFRRTEDWERLTRLEFLVDNIMRDNERRDTRIEAIVKAQEEISKVQQTICSHLRTVKNLLIGSIAGAAVTYFGLGKVLGALIGLIGLTG